MQWLADGSVITGASDGKVRKHDPNGNVVWTHASGAGSIYDVLATRDGSIVIAGQGGLVRKLTADGEVVSTRYVKSVMSTKANTDYAKSLDLGPTGDVFVLSAQGAFARINPAGDMTVLWRDEMGLEYADRIEVANDGIMYLTTYQYDSTQADKYIYDMVFGIREAGNAREIAFLQDQPSGAIFASALNKSNNRIAVADWTYNGGFKPVVRMIEPNATTPQKWSSTRPTGVVQDMSFNKDYSILFAGGSDNMLRKFNPANGADLGSYTFGSRVMSVEIGH
jgi:WD40 repeat protein